MHGQHILILNMAVPELLWNKYQMVATKMPEAFDGSPEGFMDFLTAFLSMAGEMAYQLHQEKCGTKRGRGRLRLVRPAQRQTV